MQKSRISLKKLTKNNIGHFANDTSSNGDGLLYVHSSRTKGLAAAPSRAIHRPVDGLIIPADFVFSVNRLFPDGGSARAEERNLDKETEKTGRKREALLAGKVR